MSYTNNSYSLPSSRTEKCAPDPTYPRGNLEDLRNLLLSISEWYTEGKRSVSLIEDYLLDAWDVLIQTSKMTPSTSPEQDSLVVLISSIKEFGILHRNERDTQEQETTMFSNGQKFWIDLPYLARKMQHSWIIESHQYTTTERANFAVLTAKLCAGGICEAELSFVALWLLRETLEVQRPLTKQLDIPKSENSLSITELLPACFSWLSNAKFKLIKLVAQNYDPTLSMVIESNHQIHMDIGDLAAKANITQPGFSLPRWVFWRLRLKELSRCGDAVIAKLAEQSFSEMVHTGVVLGIVVHGERNYFEKVNEALIAEFKAKGMTETVDASDININMDWAD
ncbi:hypothetical protein N7537_011459 [Penicillium hordei]|uniref:Uncharacterized protein n=1 Tax=Penicillium hordei TaxID=40994 RepID=A0AAD6GRS1_9EURO|nr:uncharacterized protein N7537_011459 [Penicillium hordei]KAJ5588781.1 hypothetical protein N7537_011459 [Penicillium hordei]